MQVPLDPYSFIAQRLMNPRSAEAAGMQLRPQLQTAAQALLAMLSKTATTPGDNSSTLLIGQRGVGKTLVSHGACRCRGQQRLSVAANTWQSEWHSVHPDLHGTPC